MSICGGASTGDENYFGKPEVGDETLAQSSGELIDSGEEDGAVEDAEPVVDEDLDRVIPKVDEIHLRWSREEELACIEEVRMYRGTRRGDRAFQRICEEYQPMIGKAISGIIQHYHLRHDCVVDDLRNAAMEGLLRAIDKFDETRRSRLASYGRQWIIQVMQTTVGNHLNIPKGRNIRQAVIRLNFAMRKVFSENPGVEMNDDTLAEKVSVILGISKEVANAAIAVMRRDRSLDTPCNDNNSDDGSTLTLYNIIADTSATQEQALYDDQNNDIISRLVHKAVAGLANDTDREIIVSRFLSNESETLESIGARLGYTKENIRIREKKALERFPSLILAAVYNEFPNISHEDARQYIRDMLSGSC